MTSFKIPPPQHGLDLGAAYSEGGSIGGFFGSSQFSLRLSPSPTPSCVGQWQWSGSGDLHVFVLPLSFILPPTRETRQRQTKSREGGRREGGMEGGAACMRSN